MVNMGQNERLIDINGSQEKRSKDKSENNKCDWKKIRDSIIEVPVAEYRHLAKLY